MCKRLCFVLIMVLVCVSSEAIGTEINNRLGFQSSSFSTPTSRRMGVPARPQVYEAIERMGRDAHPPVAELMNRTGRDAHPPLSHLRLNDTIEAGGWVKGSYVSRWGVPIIITVAVGATIYFVFIARGR